MFSPSRGRLTAALLMSLAAAGPVVAQTGSASSILAPDGALDRDALIREVLARNPTVAAAKQAVSAARARVPQVTALDDPKLSYGVAPLSLFDPQARDGHTLQVEQMLPIPGQRRLAGEVAESDARAAVADLAQT